MQSITRLQFCQLEEKSAHGCERQSCRWWHLTTHTRGDACATRTRTHEESSRRERERVRVRERERRGAQVCVKNNCVLVVQFLFQWCKPSLAVVA